MVEISYRRHRFPPVVIQHAVWLYLRFTLSYRDVKDLLAERGLDISYETVWSWVLKFGPVIARRLRRHGPEAHLDSVKLTMPMQRFKSVRSAQRFLSIHAAVHNTFNLQRHLVSRSTLRIFRAEAASEWRNAVAAV